MTRPIHASGPELSRRDFLSTAALAAGSTAALGSRAPVRRAERLVYLFQAGGPAQQDLFDPKPLLNTRHGEELPDSIRKGQRLTGMSGNQASLPLAGSPFAFAPRGESGLQLSELLPHTSRLADKLCLVRSLHTEAINHDPAITFFMTGSEIAGRPSLGAWLSYGLGSMNKDLPAFVVLVTNGSKDQPLYERLWGSGFLPTCHQGVEFRPGPAPVLFLENPPGISRPTRRRMLDALKSLAAHEATVENDASVLERHEHFEMAFRLQQSVPDVADFSSESATAQARYGDDVKKPGTYAASCLIARRLLERGVRTVQIFHQGWDQHDGLVGGITRQCRQTDQPTAALITDLEERGLLDSTLVVFGGEFGRTSYCQGRLTKEAFGRDHHPRCFSAWLAGAGVRPGFTYGATDEFGYNVIENPVHVHDFQATILHLLGLDHERLTYLHQGRRYRLTDVSGQVVTALFA